MNQLVIVGDSLLDRDIEGSVERLCPDAPVPVVDEPISCARPGGSGLAATLVARTGRPVTLITAISHDAAGQELHELLRDAGVEVIALESQGPTVEKIRIRADGRTLLRLDRGGSPAPIVVSQGDLRVITGATLLVSDYGRGITRHPDVRQAITSSSRVVWDPHPHGATPVSRCRLITPNRTEAGLTPRAGIAEISARARDLAREWNADSVAVTLGSGGALLSSGLGVPFAIPAPHVAAGDPCGAGDCFAAAAAGLIADGATALEAVTGAVSTASAFVAAGGAASALAAAPSQRQPLHGIAAARRLIAEVRARGERVVATGGCFDILHAGHIASLSAARALGGCLIVCLNSDASVRRVKGASRPVVGERDRVEILSALACVDAVVVFDEDTPEAVLGELRPDVFVKGADYELAEMPEARLVRSWGGEAVLVPYLDGYSTTELLAEVGRRAG
jgi:rfaE bifunctional protein nucleotidyltransferase chain/domain/rfaE bifunctional protein kinase chain/domain